MFVSVIVCTYRSDDYENVLDVVASLLNQTYPEIEIIIVVDGNEGLRKKIATIYNTQDNIQVIASEETIGVSGARNLGIRRARGDIIAFLDDDTVTEKRWIEDMINTYQKNDAIAVAGTVLPIWLTKKPDYLPEELYWLVGSTYEGFTKEGVTHVRNALGANMSFKREVFEKVGSFNPDFGFARKGASYIQGEEPEFGLRMQNTLGKGVIYDPNLIVYHKVSEWKTRLRILLRRAFYQGYSKALLKKLSRSPKPLAPEESYLKDLLLKYIPRRIRRVFLWFEPLAEMKQLLVLLVTILAVGLGFVYGQLRSSSRK